MEQEKKKVRITDRKIALQKAGSYCAYQERCQQEVRDKLYSFGLWPEAVEEIIAKLINDNFINEERFAKVFAGGKFRIKKWGKVKIRLELKKRNISAYCIRSAMNEIPEKDYLITLKELITIKKEKLSAKKIKGRYAAAVREQMIIQYCISRGFEADLVRDLL